MKINKFLFKVKNKNGKHSVKNINATGEDICSIPQVSSNLNKREDSAEKTLVFDACGPAGEPVIFFKENKFFKKIKRK